jgi:hypothetical protein
MPHSAFEDKVDASLRLQKIPIFSIAIATRSKIAGDRDILAFLPDRLAMHEVETMNGRQLRARGAVIAHMFTSSCGVCGSSCRRCVPRAAA